MTQGVVMGRPKTAWLDGPPRMSRRPRKRGGFNYYYQAAGKKTPLGQNLVAAKAEWARLEAGTVAWTFPRVAGEYRKLFSGFKLSTRRHYETALRNLEGTFRKFTLEQIKPHHIKTYIRQRTKKGAAMFEKRVLSAVWSWAAGEGYTHAPNPCRGITFTKAERATIAPKQPRQYVTDAMFDAVWAAGDDILRDAMDLALHTGQRPGDILNARRQDIAEGVLWFTQEKTDARVGVRIKGELAVVVERILARRRPSMFLISDRRGQRVRYNALNERFVAARGDATWQFRHIRRKASSDSPDLKRAQELLGHANETTTAVHYRDRGLIVDPLVRKTARI
jgi:integrase